jgi:hypothetical protein
MAIVKHDTHTKKTVTFFEGRVLEVKKYTARRNMSDTLDYTDVRDVECVDALVWLGAHGVPPYLWNNCTLARMPDEHSPSYGPQPRALEFYEQFAWVDCSNHFSWRGDAIRTPTVDADLHNGDPLMWANYIAWKSHQAAETQRLVAEARARHDERLAYQAAEAEKAAAREAKDLALKAGAEKLLATVVKGNTYTVDGFTGKAFWLGAKKYRGKWQARVGLKDSRGTVLWTDARKLA